MSDLRSLLPPDAGAFRRAVETVMAEPVLGIDGPIRTLWDVDACPTDLLGWLAWAFSVEVWDHGWPEGLKRNVIREAIRVHRLKGTRQSVEIALSTLGFRTDISEWFEHGGAPHTFRLDAYADDVFAAGFRIDAKLLETVTRLIRNVKPVRAHFDLRIGESFRSDSCLRTASRMTQLHRAHLDPGPRPAIAEAGLRLRTGARVRQVFNQTHEPQPRPVTARVAAFVRLSVRACTVSHAFHDIQRRAA